MKTQTKTQIRSKNLFLLAALSLAGTTLAVPALADHNNGYRSSRTYQYNNGGYNNGYNNGYMYQQRDRYARLNRVNQYGVRGRIVAWGNGPLQGCFRVKRTGYYSGQNAIVTVRYCLDHYGKAMKYRGSKQLVRYLNYYRPANSYGYGNRYSIPRY